MSNSKQKKPFLKKHTRQFLSNAQVRSQPEKSKLVQFQDLQQKIKDQKQQPPYKNHINSDISIPINKKGPSIKENNFPNIPIPKNDKKTEQSIRNNELHKKKQEKKTPMLEDYLGKAKFPQNTFKQTNLSNSKQKRQAYLKDQQKYTITNHKNTRQQLPKSAKIISMVGLLHHQQDDDDQSDYQENIHVKNKPSDKKLVINKASNNQSEKSESDSNQQYNFAQSNCQEQKASNFSNQRSLLKEDVRETKQKLFNQYIKSKQIKQQKTIQVQRPISKVSQKYFGISPNQTIKTKNQQQMISKQAIKISDISVELKRQIIEMEIKQSQQKIQKQLQKLKNQTYSAKRAKQKFEEEMKNLAKTKIEFEKQMQIKRQEFEQKIKNENSKLNRQKKYMKQHQTSNKQDWKIKQQLQEVKKNLQESINDRKKQQTRMKSQIDRLKKRLEEEINKNKCLSQQLKLVQYGKIIQKQQIKQQTKQTIRSLEKKPITNNQIPKMSYWIGAPTQSVYKRFIDHDFSLIEFPKHTYNFQNNQYYQYYLRKKDQVSQLETEVVEDDKTTRTYQNGKVEIEFYMKFLKEVFPFKYKIVNFSNGDIKQSIPQGIVVYYDQNTQISQIQISPNKKIFYFYKEDQVEMHWETEKGKLFQKYDGNIIKRVMPDSRTYYLKKTENGEIKQIRSQ